MDIVKQIKGDVSCAATLYKGLPLFSRDGLYQFADKQIAVIRNPLSPV